MMKNILVLGGGAGGAIAASRLAKMSDDVNITLVDKNKYHEFRPSYLWVGMGIREPDDVRRELKKLERKNIQFVNGIVKSINPSERMVKVDDANISYDYLVISLGAELKPELLEGLEHTYHTWELNDALRFKEAVSKFRGGKIVVGPASMPYRCPPAPFELALMLKYIAEQRGVDDKTEITIFHPDWSKPMEPFGPFMQNLFKNFLEEYKVNFVGNWKPTSIDHEKKRIVSDNDYLDYDLAVVIPPHMPPEPVSKSDLANEIGYMNIDRRTLRNDKYDEIFGIGDIIAPTLGIGMAGVFAHFEADYVASQIADEIEGVRLGMTYNKSGICVMDIGYLGAAVFCDFSKVLDKKATYPDCWLLGGMKAFRGVKMAFEKMWFAELFGR
ncbi:MAG: NAD(P)/FAD-dependent oxidoreductase [Candidatus Nitrosothermus koennekii]|nr:MAG: NAD(P)/FAD-dependent oxidoreductase [Candidatus Nitrosothermus koennekii]